MAVGAQPFGIPGEAKLGSSAKLVQTREIFANVVHHMSTLGRQKLRS
jgi:hypothetical protein